MKIQSDLLITITSFNTDVSDASDEGTKLQILQIVPQRGYWEFHVG